MSAGAVKISLYILCGDGGKNLNFNEREKFNDLLKRYEKCFQPGGKTTPFIEHCINTGDVYNPKRPLPWCHYMMDTHKL